MRNRSSNRAATLRACSQSSTQYISPTSSIATPKPIAPNMISFIRAPPLCARPQPGSVRTDGTAASRWSALGGPSGTPLVQRVGHVLRVVLQAVLGEHVLADVDELVHAEDVDRRADLTARRLRLLVQEHPERHHELGAGGVVLPAAVGAAGQRQARRDGGHNRAPHHRPASVAPYSACSLVKPSNSSCSISPEREKEENSR